MFYFNSNQISIVKENIYSIFFASVNIFFNYSFLASFHFGHLGFLTKNSQNLVRNKIVFYDVHEHESVLVKKKKKNTCRRMRLQYPWNMKRRYRTKYIKIT